jgi:heparin binding hemagglutinin HbhA
MTVVKTVTTSKPFYVVAGAGDLAVKSLREGAERLSTLRIEQKDLGKTVASLQAETKALPAKAQTVAVTLVADVAGKVGTGYDELLGRGKSVVTRIRRQKATQDLKKQATTTVRRTKATVTTATEGAAETRSAVKGATTTAKKRAAATRTSAKSTATAARKTTQQAAKAVADGAEKVGQ